MPLTISASEDMSHVVWGLDTHFDPDNPTPTLLAADSSGYSGADDFDDSFAGTAATEGGYDVLRATLTTTPLVIAGSGSQRHEGTWLHLARFFGEGDGPIWIRLAWKAGSSPRFSLGDWRSLQGFDAFYELDLGLMRVLEAAQGTQTCEWRYEAYSETPGDTLAIHLDHLIPQPGGKARTELFVGTGTASAGPNSPDTVANDSSVGSVSWSNPGNAVASDDSRATAAMSGNLSYYLKATDFDFAIPSDATITGVEARIERYASAQNVIRDSSVKLVKGGAVVGLNQAGSRYWPTIESSWTHGDTGDLWGVTLTPADVNATNFGVVLSIRSVAGSHAASVDHIRITIYYTEASETPDRVLHAGKSMEIRHDMVIRETPNGEWGRIATEGAYLKVPPAGREGRVSRLVVKARRNDVDVLPDDVIDDEISASLTVTPRVSILGA